MLSRVRKLASEASWLVCGQFATMLSSILLIRVLTDRISVEQYGDLTLAMTVTTFFNLCVFGGLTSSASRFLSVAKSEGEVDAFYHGLSRLLRLALAGSCMVGLVGSIAFGFLAGPAWVAIFIAAVSLAVISGIGSVIAAVQNASRNRAVVAISSSAIGVLKVALIVIATSILPLSTTGVLLIYFIATFAVTFWQLLVLRRQLGSSVLISQRYECAWGRRLLEYAWPFSTWGVVVWGQVASDRWALEVFQTTEEVGLYAAVHQLSIGPTRTAISLLMSFAAPILFQQAGGEGELAKQRKAKEHVLITVMIALAITAVFFLLAYRCHVVLFKYAVGEQFRSASYLFPWLILSAGMLAAGQLASLGQFSGFATRGLIFPKVISGLIGIGIAFAGGAFFGIQGVVASQIAFSGIHLVWMIRLVWRDYRRC